ncbi:hypothetical protein PoB_006972100 [Plakobranchus ocellatus]|uniref:BAR domain-containing protein n=1 Tax=Plakobranchus ocellatus TaxID=259542 RepID=A0AAV4DH84_9GAST|nr:hypothetical protein PoB_006972100 [Plakobranchus ocellatus]
MHTSTLYGKKIGMLREQTSSMNYSPTWEKTSAKEVKEKVENGRRFEPATNAMFDEGQKSRDHLTQAVDRLYDITKEIFPCFTNRFCKLLFPYLSLT